MTPRAVLGAVGALLADPAAWSGWGEACDSRGLPVYGPDRRAVRWNLAGAVRRVVGARPLFDPLVPDVLAALAATVAARGWTGGLAGYGATFGHAAALGVVAETLEQWQEEVAA